MPVGISVGIADVLLVRAVGKSGIAGAFGNAGSRMRRLTVRRSGKRRYINVGVGLRSISHSRGLGSIVVLRLRAVLGGIISFVIFAALIILFVRMHAVIFSVHSGGTRISSGSCQHEVSVLIEISARHARTV